MVDNIVSLCPPCDASHCKIRAGIHKMAEAICIRCVLRRIVDFAHESTKWRKIAPLCVRCVMRPAVGIAQASTKWRTIAPLCVRCVMRPVVGIAQASTKWRTISSLCVRGVCLPARFRVHACTLYSF
ncbi:unnamed protein product [Colias eurytheme]|nr:unnamed protein product [Colias eurytheme]